MSADHDTTQPIPASELPPDAPVPRGAYDASHATHAQTGTLPSAAIPATVDGTNGTGAQPANQATEAAFAFAMHQQTLPNYMKPTMTQSQGFGEEDSANFAEKINDPAPGAPAVAQASDIAHLVTEASPRPQMEQPVQASTAAKQQEMENSAEERASSSDALVPPQLTLDSSQEIQVVIKDKSPKKQAHDDDNNDATSVEGLSDAGDDEADRDDESSTSEKMRDIAMMEGSSQKTQTRAQARKQATPPNTRLGRRRPPVSASQGVRYDYTDQGTLQNDSEDEDGGWNSDDEVRATQQLETHGRQFKHAYKRPEDSDEDEAPKSLQLEDLKELPPPKKAKPSETSDAPEIHVLPPPTTKPSADDDVEYTETVKAPHNHSRKSTQTIDDDEPVDDPINRPRPSLGGVGVFAKKLDPESAKKVQAKESSAAAKRARASQVVDKQAEEVEEAPKRIKSPASVSTTSGKKKNPASMDISDEEGEEDEEVVVLTKSKKGAAATSSKKASPPTSKANSASKKKVSKHHEDEEEEEQEDYYEAEEEEEVPPPRPKRTREESAGAGNKKGKKTHLPAAELARQLRTQARESIAAYLQNESEDMMNFFTQRQLNMPGTEEELPSDFFSRFHFIVTGLRTVGEEAASPEFVKTQLKVLGGNLVNFVTSNVRAVQVSKNLQLPNTILISEKPQRTLKYISALANAVPCVHYRWFLACLHLGKLQPLNEYLLPAGFNEDAAMVPCPDWITSPDLSAVEETVLYPFIVPVEDAQGKKKRRKVEQCRIEVIGHPEFQEQWKSTLKQAGARIVQRLHEFNTGQIDYILSDHDPSPFHQHLAKKRGLPLCTIDWALQTIIQRKLQDPRSKPAYTLDIGDE